MFVSQNTATSFHHYNTSCGMISQFSSKQISYVRVMHCQPTSACYVLTALYFHVPKPPPFGARGCLRKRNAVPRLQAALAGQENGRKVAEGKK